MIKNIVKDGDNILRTVCREQTNFDARLADTLDDMFETMAVADGVGLAAPQIGILRRYVVIDANDVVLEMVNPVIISRSGEQIGVEGCLSVEGRQCKVKRAEKVTIEFQDRTGVKHTEEFSGFPARACQHEIDHLDGILFYDKAYTDNNGSADSEDE